MKKMFKTMFFISLALIILSLFVLGVFLFTAGSKHSTGVGIIGGADGPTAVLITRSFLLEPPVLCLVGTATVLFISSAIGWIVTKNK